MELLGNVSHECSVSIDRKVRAASKRLSKLNPDSVDVGRKIHAELLTLSAEQLRLRQEAAKSTLHEIESTRDEVVSAFSSEEKFIGFIIRVFMIVTSTHLKGIEKVPEEFKQRVNDIIELVNSSFNGIWTDGSIRSISSLFHDIIAYPERKSSVRDLTFKQLVEEIDSVFKAKLFVDKTEEKAKQKKAKTPRTPKSPESTSPVAQPTEPEKPKKEEKKEEKESPKPKEPETKPKEQETKPKEQETPKKEEKQPTKEKQPQPQKEQAEKKKEESPKEPKVKVPLKIVRPAKTQQETTTLVVENVAPVVSPPVVETKPEETPKKEEEKPKETPKVEPETKPKEPEAPKPKEQEKPKEQPQPQVTEPPKPRRGWEKPKQK